MSRASVVENKRMMEANPGIKYGKAPSVILVSPKYPHNLGTSLRAAACWGIEQLWYTRQRISYKRCKKGADRLPRELRSKGYGHVDLFNHDKPLDQFDHDVVPVAVELLPNAESLVTFEHPDKAVYIFGPEDGTLGREWLSLCHRRVSIPTRHCLNLSAAVNVVLYDRFRKLTPHLLLRDTLREEREWNTLTSISL